MSRKALIDSEPSNAAKSDAEALAWLREELSVPDSSLKGMRAVMGALSIAESETVINTITSVAASNVVVSEAYKQLQGDGLDFSHANTVGMINQMFDFDHTIRDKLLALGAVTMPRDEANGLPASRLSDVQKARAQ